MTKDQGVKIELTDSEWPLVGAALMVAAKADPERYEKLFHKVVVQAIEEIRES